ncbi:MAG TPA: hypothetical protein ENN97_02920 [Phycisphaerales bacterium]|nr:hypothetical protein [Phycisphaerales bacterium]
MMKKTCKSAMALLLFCACSVFGASVILNEYNIEWSHTGTVNNVKVEFSHDNGKTWMPVYPPNTGNAGVYSWQVPLLDSDDCLVRISNAADLLVFDISDAVFSVYQCDLEGDVTGDCRVNLDDFVLLASSWLECANPYDIGCW